MADVSGRDGPRRRLHRYWNGRTAYPSGRRRREAARKLQAPADAPAGPEHGEAAFYVVDLAAPFSGLDTQGGAFTLTIESEDWWMPDYFAVFGADTAEFGPNALIPFVAASALELRQMSSDPSESWHSIVLSTARVLAQRPVRPEVDVDDVDGVFGARVRHDEAQEPASERESAS